MTKEAVADFLLVAFNHNQKKMLEMIADQIKGVATANNTKGE
ncbi:hypothetical protein [Cysteiniphilum litorale]